MIEALDEAFCRKVVSKEAAHIMTEIIQRRASSKNPIITFFRTIPSASSIRNFEQILSEEIENELDYTGIISIAIEHQPDNTLCLAAKQAGINPKVFPHHTYMCIHEKNISVYSKNQLISSHTVQW